MKITSDELITDEYVFFYSGIYSQWYPCEFEVELFNQKLTVNCAEQAMMLSKALFFWDAEAFENILKEKDPKKQKALGRKVRNFNKKAWDKECRRIVYTINFAKFTSIPVLKAMMLSVGDRKFVEASPTDAIWGIKRSLRDPLNWLGQILDDVKASIERMTI